jgi:polyisoprenoid-binding protein YceI
MSAIETTQQVIPAGTWVVDPVHTTVGFQVTETTDLFSTINGRFTDVEGRLEGGETPSITGAVRVASLRTDNEQRDAHLVSPDFLEGEKHPEIYFASKSIEPIDGERFLVRGDVTVKDTPFEVELEARFRGLGQGKLGDERLLVDARGAFDWGTTTVELNIAVSAGRQA